MLSKLTPDLEKKIAKSMRPEIHHETNFSLQEVRIRLKPWYKSRSFWGGVGAGLMDILWILVCWCPPLRREVWKTRSGRWYLEKFPKKGEDR